MEDVVLKGPYRMSMAIYVTDGERSASTTYEFPPGKPVTEEMRKEGVDKALGFVQAELGEDWRLCTKQEFWDYTCDEQFGTRFALPGGSEWDA